MTLREICARLWEHAWGEWCPGMVGVQGAEHQKWSTTMSPPLAQGCHLTYDVNTDLRELYLREGAL